MKHTKRSMIVILHEEKVAGKILSEEIMAEIPQILCKTWIYTSKNLKLEAR